MRIVQLSHPQHGRRVAIVEEPSLRLIANKPTLYACVLEAAAANASLSDYLEALASDSLLEYDPIYNDESEWKLLTPIDHPDDPCHCLVTGTGLTHSKGAANRDAMHQMNSAAQTITDSMKIYQWGVEGGKPEAGQIGVQPEWFYKGQGDILRAHNLPLDLPEFGEDGGEEPELAGIYVIDQNGVPLRVGFAVGNEFSDHKMEQRNYLYLAPSKLRTCAIGPELVINGNFQNVVGKVAIFRDNTTFWEHRIATGEAHMTHSLANLEYHHFKYPAHRRPTDVHVHFFGTGAFSFGSGIALQDGDIMQVEMEEYGRPLRNFLYKAATPAVWFGTNPLV